MNSRRFTAQYLPGSAQRIAQHRCDAGFQSGQCLLGIICSPARSGRCFLFPQRPNSRHKPWVRGVLWVTQRQADGPPRCRGEGAGARLVTHRWCISDLLCRLFLLIPSCCVGDARHAGVLRPRLGLFGGLSFGRILLGWRGATSCAAAVSACLRAIAARHFEGWTRRNGKRNRNERNHHVNQGLVSARVVVAKGN